MQDVVVIGGGMAGVAAALASAGRGARVTLVRRAPGATSLSVGGWQGPLPATLAAHFHAVDHPWHACTALLPAADGFMRRFDWAAPAQAAAQFSDTTLVCGIVGLSALHASMLARLWRESTGQDVVAVSVQLDGTPAAGWSVPALAAQITRTRDRFASQVAREVEKARAGSVILPPVLDLHYPDGNRRAVQSAAGVPAGETLGCLPSLPGWRLNDALERMVQRAGVTVLTGTATLLEKSGRRIQRVTLQSSADAQQLEARAFVLATGKFVGGGIGANGQLRENALDCPVWIEHAGEIFDESEPLALTNADRREEQPLLAAGVAVDAEDRPVNQSGEPVFENVWAAGAVRRGYDHAGRGLGHAAAEGWAAGERAAS